MNDELPSGWENVALGELGKLHCGQSPPSSAVNRQGNGTPYVSGPEQWDGKSVHLDKWTTAPAREVCGNTIFITVKGAGVGTTFPGVAASIGRDIYAFEPSSEINTRYIHRAIDHTIAEILKGARGDIPGLAKPDIIDHKIGLSPAAEQHRIIAKIDSLFSRSSRARDELAHIPRLIERYRQAVLEAAFRGDLTADWRMTSPSLADPTQTVADLAAQRTKTGSKRASLSPPAPDASEIYPLPDELPWHRTTLEQVCHQSRGIPYGIIQTGKQFDGGVPTVRCGDIKNFRIDLSILKLVDPVIASEYERTVLKGGEVLIAIRGSVGETAVVPPTMAGMNISREVAMVPVLPAMNAAFVCYLLASPHGASFLARHTKGVAQTGINLSDLRAFPVPIPSAAEQAEIVRKIEQQFLAVQRIAQETSLAASRISRLDQSILDKAFTGKLVPQDPADEPASSLLDRIKATRESAPKAKRGRRSKA